jgi:hypothetical protein
MFNLLTCKDTESLIKNEKKVSILPFLTYFYYLCKDINIHIKMRKYLLLIIIVTVYLSSCSNNKTKPVTDYIDMSDSDFQNDCLAFTLFSNNIQSQFGTNHWIPFTELEVNARSKFESNFMTDFIAGKVKIENQTCRFIFTTRNPFRV